MISEAPPRRLLVLADLYFAAKLKECARSFSFETLGARDEQSAFERIETHAPEAVFLSMNRDGFDWRAFLSALRANAATSTLPVLVFGSHVDRDGFREAEALGADIIVPNSRVASEFPYLLASLVKL
ncbi:hypothetical protein FJZ36_07900 [Candidatus Poribacteria bacterium]|nr:hypothetical protein [Candidatus Poribacteria bacterium]